MEAGLGARRLICQIKWRAGTPVLQEVLVSGQEGFNEFSGVSQG